MLPPHCHYTANFEANKRGNRGDGTLASKDVERASSASLTQGSDQAHLLNDANHIETPNTFIMGAPTSANNFPTSSIFCTALALLVLTLNLLAW
ncbi:unnamed protein product [Rodentolepis nana]|uniref:Uncharacterized protein n=1 Tax=Rodentolepis nana TaxID=102285 RepID=A0A0R3T242_RODNA|nr:unnamed protein product [Rodentolepis nana]